MTGNNQIHRGTSAICARARLFVSRRHGCSPESVRGLVDELAQADISCEIVEISSNPRLWSEAGQRTVPALELLLDGQTRYSWAGTLDAAIIVAAARSPEKPVEPVPYVDFRVVYSTGCHRYSRWNEQALASNASDAGWSSISATTLGKHRLILDTMTELPLIGVSFLPRPWQHSIEFKRSFPATVCVRCSLDGESWQNAASNVQLEVSEQDYVKIQFPPRAARFVELTFSAGALRREGKDFCQFMKMRLWHLPTRFDRPQHVAFDLPLPETDTAQIVKRGLLFGSDSRVERWSMREGQELPVRLSDAADFLWFVLRGCAQLSWGESLEHKRVLPCSASAFVPRGCLFALHALSATELLSVTRGTLDEVWANRK